jgi:tetratricopeptide (TPR) repeat protein
LRIFKVVTLACASAFCFAAISTGQSTENSAAGQPMSPVRVWQDTIELPTYEQGMPNENPPFDQFVTNDRYNYPYTLLDNLTGRVTPRKLRALNLENEYLSCVVLPDFGGHLYRCRDKRNGAELFYANPSLKFARIAYRGAWAAYGIEFNFPVSHNWMTASPVDFATSTAADGSASVWVRNIDRPYGMEWSVELTLRPGRAVLEQKTTLYNPGRGRHRFYWWTNAGVQVWDDTRIFYPTEYTISHGFTDLDTWPVNRDGVDLSVVGNHKYGPVSRFSYASNEPWMAVYHPSTGTGLVHYSTRTNLPSKKFWSWGSDADGLQWREALSDNHSAYVEVQAGLFRDQETYGFLDPQEKIRFVEYWMPVRDIGGVTRANPDAAINTNWDFSHGDFSLVDVALNVFRDLPKAKVEVRDDAGVLASESVSLTPAGTYRMKPIPVRRGHPLTVTVTDETGKVILLHTDGKYDYTPKSEVPKELPRAYVYPSAEKRSESDFLQLGDDQERYGMVLEAVKTYRQGLERFEGSVELHKAAGRLAVGLKQYRPAIADLAMVLTRVSNDQEAAYYLGLAHAATGEPEKARRAFEISEQFGTFRAPSLYELAALDARKGDLGKAHDKLAAADTEFPDAARLADVDVTLLRLLGDTVRAKTHLTSLRGADPANLFLRYEVTRLGGTDAALWEHLAGDPSRILEIAAQYMHFGLWGEAAELLAAKYPSDSPGVAREPGMPKPEDDPMIAYYRGYCREMAKQDGSADDAAAAKMSTTYVFPNRAESLEVLRRAIAVNANDANAHALLGDLYMSGGMEREAMEEWSVARGLNPAIPALLRNMGSTAMYLRQPPEKAIELFTDGVNYDAQNAENYLGLERALKAAGRPAAEQAAALRKFPGKHPPAVLVFELARDLAEAGEYEAAVRQLADHFVSMEEGGASRLSVYLEIQLTQAKALAAAGKCGPAKTIVDHLGDPVSQLSLTAEELAEGLQAKRVKEQIAVLEQRCPK